MLSLITNLWAIFAVATVIGAAYWFCDIRFMRALKRHQPEIWKELEVPGHAMAQRIFIEWRQFWFLFRRRYAAFPQAEIRIYGDLTLLCSCMAWLLALYLLILAGIL